MRVVRLEMFNIFDATMVVHASGTYLLQFLQIQGIARDSHELFGFLNCMTDSVEFRDSK